MRLLIVIILIIGISIGGAWWISRIQARKLNAKYNTTYTASDLFWYGDKIIVSDYIKLKD